MTPRKMQLLHNYWADEAVIWTALEDSYGAGRHLSAARQMFPTA